MLLKTMHSSHPYDTAGLIKAGVVSTSLDTFRANITHQLTAIQNCSITISPEEYKILTSGKLSENFSEPLVFDKTHFKGLSVFKDLVSHESTLKDNGLSRSILGLIQGKYPEKAFSFTCKKIVCSGLKAIPLTADEYKAGLPFQLSRKTGHCDFPGLAGGNYPIAEYLSADLLSVKIIDEKDNYIGHFNICKTTEKNFCFGTIAMRLL
ncbi:hypothetical protein ACOZB2_22605 [Pantoea endophytica]|uniref:Uncharacterized protein n=1 Tax=Pantoea sp. BJ2 TaxID=3141322 RepID=A0AAU7U3C8_9GAMM